MEGLKKLFQVKRILAMVLAVTLAVTSAPVTAQAAPENISVQTETNVEETPTEEVSTGDTPTEETPDGEVPADGTLLEDPPAGDSPAEDVSLEGTDADAEESVEKSDPEAVNPDQKDKNTATDSVEESAPAAQDDAPQGQKAEIRLNNLADLEGGDITVSGWDEAKQTATVTTAYDDTNDNPFGTIMTSLQNGYYVSIEGVSDDEAEALKSQLKFVWKQKGADGSYADMSGASAPVNAGEYRLEISIDPAFVSADAKSIDFVIEKAKLYVKVDSDTEQMNFTGKTVGDVKEAYFKALQIALGENGSVDERYLQFVTAADKSVVKVGAPLGEAMADTEVLKKDGDYYVEIAPALKEGYQANYELIPYAHNIAITDLKTVSLTVESNLEPGKDITYVYKKEAVKAPTDATAALDKQVTVKITVTGETDAATGKEKELPVVLDGDKKNITGVWLDADKEALAEGKVPENAGVYYYKLTYTDPDGVYGVAQNAADCLVKVVITPAKLAIRPALADDKKQYQKDTAASALLKNVSYTLIERDDDGKYTTKKFEIPDEEKDTFWGVSYNQPGKPQYYAPVFQVEKRVTTTTTYTDTTKKAQTVEGSWTKVSTLSEASGETKDEAASNASQTVTKKVEYRVVFAGKKSLYTNGVASNNAGDVVDINKQIDVNNANTNYDVDVTKDVVEDAANVVAITVVGGTKVTINTDDIKANIDKDMTPNAEGVYTKVYNEKAPFADRSGYKKAKTDKAEADAAGSFTYEWYGYDMVDKLDDKGEVVKDGAGKPVQEPECNDVKVGTDNDYTLTTLANAAEYCLKISYTDPTKTYMAEPAYLYFKIEGKSVKVKPKQDPKPKAYTGETVSDFLNSIKETMEYDIVEVNADGTDGTNLTDTLKTLDKQINEANKNSHLYNLNWVVLKGDNVDPAKAKFTKAYSYETFEKDIPYKLGAELTFNSFANKEYNKYNLNYTNVYERPETDPIQHNWRHDPADIEVGVMGDVGLKIAIHSEKLAAFETVYSGEEQFKVEDLIAAGYITVAAENAPDTLLPIGSGEGQVPLVFKWEWKKFDSSRWQLLGEGIGNPLNAGEYRLTVSFPGDEKYHKFEAMTLGDYNGDTDEYNPGDHFFINQKELTIKVAGDKVKSDLIAAGLDMLEISESAKLVDTDGLTVTGYIEADKEAFAEGATAGTGLVKDAPAFRNAYNVLVWEKGKKDSQDLWSSRYKGYLRYGKEYDLGVNAWIDAANAKTLKDQYEDNYFISCEGASFKVTKRGNSTVANKTITHSDDIADSGSYTMYVRSSAEDNKVTVTPVSGICYFYQQGDTLSAIPAKEFVPGNYLIFNIMAPKEFDANGDSNYSSDYSAAWGNFVYENSIVKDGKGYVLDRDGMSGTITVAFPVTAADKAEKRTFTILWEKDYTEEYTVDLSAAKLEDDLRTAVSPKTLAFNGVKTKMTVGETQQLDVKMAKVLNSDVVFLNYKVAAGSEKFASVTTETGVVTALKKGKATIEVYPVRRNTKGEVEKVPDFKKTVKTTITISDVTAPKINSVYAYDYQFELKYTQPEDGYRREIYVLEGKKKNTEFETKISEAQDGGKNKLNEAFVAYSYIAPASENPNKAKVVTKTVSGIKPGKEYTVYVRNVSGVRKLDDDSQVTVSALGTVKTFKATKVQLLSIRLDYKTNEEMAKKTPAADKLYKDSAIDEIDLSKGSVQLQAWGEFKMQPEKENAEDSAYGIDHEWKELPLAKGDANYEAQKLTYYAVESPYGYTKEQIAQYKLDGYKTLIGDRYYRPSTIAKIDKKGKLTLKGIGIVYIIAYDSVSKKITPMSSGYLDNIDTSREVSTYDSHYALRITSPISKIQAKQITLKTGSHVSVRSGLTFLDAKNKKIAIGASGAGSIPITVKSEDSEAVEVEGDYIIAKEPDQTVNLTVYLTNNPDVSTTLTVKTKKMDPVKAVKAVDVIDHSARITFTHTGNEVDYHYQNGVSYYWGSEPIRFKIDLLDNRKRLISSHIDDCTIDWSKTNEKKSTYAYYYDIQGLKRQSVYNVTVTPIYGKAEAAKGANGKVTTTNIPASEASVGKAPDGTLYTGGMSISIDSEGGSTLDQIGYLTSGNSYTLIANANNAARQRKSDTLTWKSTNSKVASVKANTGSYTATLKAASVGYTYIEVTSKITKKVIARYIVRVKSVSNGGQGAYGDTEPVYNVAWDDTYDQGIEVLTEKNPVSFKAPMGAYDYRWISFTAPADGRYYFNGPNVSIAGYYYKTAFPEQYDGGSKSSFEENSSATLNEGDTIYFKAAGVNEGPVTVYVNATKYGKLTGSDAVSVTGLGQLSFTAPEDNYYTFYATASGKQAYCDRKSGYITFATETNAPVNAGVGLKKGQKVTLTNLSSGDYSISVKGRTYTAFDAAGKASTGSLADKEGSVKGKWFVFEAKAAGEYTFTVTPDKAGAMEAKYYADLTKSESEFGNIFTTNVNDGKETLSLNSMSLNEGDKRAIYVYATGEEAVSADVTVSQPKTAEVTLAAATGKLEVKNGEPVWVSFKVPEAGKEYCFSYEVETGKSVSQYYYKNTVGNNFYPSNDRFTSQQNDKIIYIKLITTDESAKIKVSVKETAATAIALATDAPFEVTNDNKQFFTFTAPTTGLYRFETTLAAESAGKTVSVQGAYRIEQSTGTYSLGADNVKKLLAGEKQLLAVVTGSSDAVKGNLKVTAISVDPLEAKEYTFAANETKYFKYTPNAAGKYQIACTGSGISVTWGSALDNIMSSMPYNDTLSAGEVVYVKAENGADAESKLTFTITAMDQPLPADGKISVKANQPVTYKYPVTQAGRYRVTWTADPADAVVTVNYSKSRIASGGEIVCNTKGETVTFTVSATKDAAVTLKMEPIVPSTTLEATVAKEGGVQWFEYTAPATGRYTLALTDDANKAIAADASVSAMCTWGEITNEEEAFNASPDSPWTVWFEKGGKWYCRVQNNGTTADQKVKIAVTQIKTSESLVVGADPLSLTFTENEVKWYNLAITEETLYDITAEGVSMELWQDRYGDVDDDYTDIDSSDKLLLRKGTYLVRVVKSGEAAAKIGIKKVPMLELKEGEDLSVTAANNDTQYITFKPSKTAYYAFRLKDTDGVDNLYAYMPAATESGSDASISLDKDATWSYCPQKLAVAKTNNIQLTLKFTPATEGEKKTVKLSVEEIVPAALVTELPVSVEKGARSFFTFTAPETGYYDFTEDSKDVVVMANYTYGTNLPATYDSSMSFPGKVYLSENSKVTFGVYYDGLKTESTLTELPAKADFKVSVKKYEPEELSLTTANTIAFAENETEKWYALKPEYYGTYQLKFTGSEGSIDVRIGKGNSQVAGWYSMTLTEEELIKNVNMDGGEVYLVKITSQDHPTFRLEVTWNPPVDITRAVTMGVGNESAPVTYVTIDEGDYALYRFTAYADRWYTFYTDGYETLGQDPDGTLYNEWLEQLAEAGDISSNDYDFAIAQYLEAGKTYYLKVSGWNGNSLTNCPLYVVDKYINFGQDDVED